MSINTTENIMEQTQIKKLTQTKSKLKMKRELLNTISFREKKTIVTQKKDTNYKSNIKPSTGPNGTMAIWCQSQMFIEDQSTSEGDVVSVKPVTVTIQNILCDPFLYMSNWGPVILPSYVQVYVRADCVTHVCLGLSGSPLCCPVLCRSMLEPTVLPIVVQVCLRNNIIFLIYCFIDNPQKCMYIIQNTTAGSTVDRSEFQHRCGSEAGVLELFRQLENLP